MMLKTHKHIYESLKIGAKLQSSEGDMKCWLEFEDGTKQTVRKDTAINFVNKYEKDLVFGEDAGVRLKDKIIGGNK